MPCRDHESDWGNQDKINALTQNLCFVCGNIESINGWSKLGNTRIKKWWDEHREADEERVTKKMDKLIQENVAWRNPQRLASHFIKKAVGVHPVSEWHKKWFFNLAVDRLKLYSDVQRVKNSIKSKLSAEELASLGL